MHQPNSKAINKSQNSFIETSHLSIHKDNVSLNEKESNRSEFNKEECTYNTMSVTTVINQYSDISDLKFSDKEIQQLIEENSRNLTPINTNFSKIKAKVNVLNGIISKLKSKLNKYDITPTSKNKRILNNNSDHLLSQNKDAQINQVLRHEKDYLSKETNKFNVSLSNAAISNDPNKQTVSIPKSLKSNDSFQPNLQEIKNNSQNKTINRINIRKLSRFKPNEVLEKIKLDSSKALIKTSFVRESSPDAKVNQKTITDSTISPLVAKN